MAVLQCLNHRAFAVNTTLFTGREPLLGKSPALDGIQKSHCDDKSVQADNRPGMRRPPGGSLARPPPIGNPQNPVAHPKSCKAPVTNHDTGGLPSPYRASPRLDLKAFPTIYPRYSQCLPQRVPRFGSKASAPPASAWRSAEADDQALPTCASPIVQHHSNHS